MSLYNALHGTNLTLETTDLQPLRLEQVLYRSFYNDVSYLVDGRIVVLIEHQSTVNENMPLRFLLYIARLYEKLTEAKARYAVNAISLPTPEFYVFYNGTADYATEKTLKLSDSFRKQTKLTPLELSVTVYNINHIKHQPLLAKCRALDEFSAFVETVRSEIQKDAVNGFSSAIKTCIKQGILLDYLQRKNTEVVNMLLAEYDYDLDMQVKSEEAFERGVRQGVKQGISEGAHQKALETARILKSLGDSPEKISKATGLTLEECGNDL